MECDLFFKRKGDTDFRPLEIDSQKRSLFASDRPLGLPIHDLSNELTCEFSTFDNEGLVEFFTADIKRQLEAFHKKVNLMSELIIQRSDNPIRGTITRRKLRKWHYKGQVFVQDMDGQQTFVGIRRGDEIIFCDGTKKKFNDFRSRLCFGSIKWHENGSKKEIRRYGL